MTQHTHIEIPVSEGEDVKPISYMEQVKYTRSFYTVTFIARYFLINFNLHEVHHAYPGLPAYCLDKIDLDIPQETEIFRMADQGEIYERRGLHFQNLKADGKNILK